MLIDSGLSNDFWVEVIEMANNLQNKLPIRSRNYREMILKEFWNKEATSL